MVKLSLDNYLMHVNHNWNHELDYYGEVGLNNVDTISVLFDV